MMLGLGLVPRALLSLLLSLHSAGAVAAGSGAAPRFRELKSVCPGEGGCTYGAWTAKAPVIVYRGRSTAAEAFRLQPGEKVTGLESILALTRVGKCTAKAEMILTTVADMKERRIAPGTKFDGFYYAGEGCMVGALDGAAVDVCEEDKYVCKPAPMPTLWLKVKNQAGVVGWTKDRDMLAGTSQYD
jgi:hypothetical protein